MDTGKEKVKTEIVIDHLIPVDVLDDLGSRFIINVPEEERKDLVRLCFQIELAHWHYLDFYCSRDCNLKPCGMKDFATHMFKHVPSLRPHAEEVDLILSSWRGYKMAVPTYGAIILNKELTHVLLVQSFFARSSWGFPKGKVNCEEDPDKCAVREVLEETGFDISKSIDPEEYIESNFYDQMIRLYVICGVPMDTTFKPRTRNEIKAVQWFPISDLPTSKKDMTPKVKMGVNPNSFYMVVPFVKRLRRWIFDKQHSSSNNIPRRSRHRSMGDVNESSCNTSASAMISPSASANANGRRLVDSPDNLTRNGGRKQSHNQLMQTLPTELRELQINSSTRQANNSSPLNPRAKHDKSTKQSSKRKLFVNSPGVSDPVVLAAVPAALQSNAVPMPSQATVLPKKTRVYTNNKLQGRGKSSNRFEAASWLNFKFDREDLLRVFSV